MELIIEEQETEYNDHPHNYHAPVEITMQTITTTQSASAHDSFIDCALVPNFQEKDSFLFPSLTSPPNKIFIVPYRNRAQQKFFFSKYMSFLLEDTPDEYEIYFSHQNDERNFNRGATKNIGFLAIKEKYPNHYRTMNFIFNDVDSIPFNKIFTYTTEPGIVKHYYGYEYALGGIVVIRGEDFEKINGYPCFWGWGMEDNGLQKRCIHAGLTIDRSIFYPIGSPEILQLFDGVARIISKKDPGRMENDQGIDGLRTIQNLEYSIDPYSLNLADNIHVFENPRIHYINIQKFTTLYPFEKDTYYQFDLREPVKNIAHLDSSRINHQPVSTTDDWKKIPYCEHTFITPSGKQYRSNVPQQLPRGQPMQQRPPVMNQPMPPRPPSSRPINMFSREYAVVNHIKPRATTSARVGFVRYR